MKTYSHSSPPKSVCTTRAGPNGGEPSVQERWVQVYEIKIKQQTHITASNKMKKERKKQDDRMLKRLPQNERRKQQRLRRQIQSDPLFAVA